MCVHALTLATTNTHQGLVMRLLYIRTYIRMYVSALLAYARTTYFAGGRDASCF